MRIIFFISILLISCTISNAKLDSNKFERKMIALMRVLKYIIERPEQMNVDTTFGVTFAEANIRAALQHRNAMLIDNHERNILDNILELSNHTRYILIDSVILKNKDMIKMNEKLNRPEIWIKPIIWKKLSFQRNILHRSHLTFGKTIDFMFNGHPQENESDECFIHLIDHCQLTDRCEEFLIANDNKTTGYPLTHKLLILQTMSALDCETDISRFTSYLSHKFCSLILEDLMYLEFMEFPYVGKDLASEQVFLCGMEGYLDFLNDHYEQLILDWQHPSGCYSGIRNERNRIRRSGTFTDFGCVNHATGLGAATLALFIRKDIELLRK